MYIYTFNVENSSTILFNDWEREGLVRLIDWLSEYKLLAHPYITDNAPHRPQLILDIIESYLQGRPLPDPALYGYFLYVDDPSPIPKAKCICNVSPDDENDQVRISTPSLVCL